jgi:ATP synthase protein I
MTDDPEQKSFDDLSARLNKARQASPNLADKGTDIQPENTGIAQAFRIGVDMLSALVVGTVMGWYLDHWLGTKPWFLILFIFLGGAAGIMNVYRTGMRMVADAETESKAQAKQAESVDFDKNKSEK